MIENLNEKTVFPTPYFVFDWKMKLRKTFLEKKFLHHPVLKSPHGTLTSLADFIMINLIFITQLGFSQILRQCGERALPGLCASSASQAYPDITPIASDRIHNGPGMQVTPPSISTAPSSSNVIVPSNFLFKTF